MAKQKNVSITSGVKPEPTPDDERGNLGVMALAGVVVSAMIGGGIYSLPQNVAMGASVGAVILAWIITGIGIYFIANTFRILSIVKPDLTTGVYMYSKEGFGRYVGFTVGWSYWLCQICGNVGYALITMDALNYFFPPYFVGGNNLYSLIGGSLLIWFFNALVLRGIKKATVINLIGTAAKIVPLLFFIVVALIYFNSDKFSFDFWGEKSGNLGDLTKQIEGTMLVSLWAFIGIESAVVMSKHAKTSRMVGKATMLAFAFCWLLYLLMSVLPYGILSQDQLADLHQPSTAAVLETVIGQTGAYIMNIGLLISVLVSWLAWTMVTVQIPQAAAENGTFPREFAKENAVRTPFVSLYTTSFVMQILLLLVYFSPHAWNTILSITSVMVLPAYFASAMYLWKLCEDYEYPTGASIRRSAALFTAVLGAVYALWLIYAAGLNYLLLSFIFMALGIPVFVHARHQSAPHETAFTECERLWAWLLAIVALVSLYGLMIGVILV